MTESPAYALITGASGGLGEEFARRLARRRRPLILAARSGEALRRLAGELAAAHGIATQVVETDLSRPGAAQALHDHCRARGWRVDLLVNNAGFGILGGFLEQDPDRQERMIALNVAALTRLTRLFAADMAADGGGAIVNVASVAGFQPVPWVAAYGATKAYVLNFTEAVGEELAQRGVHLMALCPGPTRTNFFTAAGGDENTFRAAHQTPRQVVDEALRGLDARRRVVVTGWPNRLLVFSQRFGPRFVVRKIAAALVRH